jgi:hypothetical protein
MSWRRNEAGLFVLCEGGEEDEKNGAVPVSGWVCGNLVADDVEEEDPALTYGFGDEDVRDSGSQATKVN